MNINLTLGKSYRRDGIKTFNLTQRTYNLKCYMKVYVIDKTRSVKNFIFMSQSEYDFDTHLIETTFLSRKYKS